MDDRDQAPSSANAVLLSETIRHAVLSERFKNTEARRILRVLDREVLPDLVGRIAARLENISTRGFDTGPATTARLKFLYRDLRQIFDELAKRLRLETEPRLERYALSTASKLAREIKAAVGSLAPVVTPGVGAVRRAVFSRPFEGALLRQRWAGRARGFRLGVEEQVRIGLIQGEPPAQIIQRVRALFPTQRKRTAGLVRTAVAHAQSQARQATFEDNADILRGVMWTATLDVSTCPECGALDGKVFPVDSGPRPPLHLGPCRCGTVPVLKSARELNGTRASMDGQVPRSLRWQEWVDDQSAERQDEIFGRGVARLYRAGRIDVADMSDGAGNRLSLERLEELASR